MQYQRNMWTSLLWTSFQYLNFACLYVYNLWRWWSLPFVPPLTPHRVYFLSEEHELDSAYETVPEDTVYVEEWIQNGVKKCNVRYEGDVIPRAWSETPFDKKAKCPWIWVGDRDTEVDLTRTFDKFCVVGNRIQLDLVLKLIHITERTNLVYIESGTFKEVKFPGEGIVIVADEESL
jgi:hypothetical protein